MGVLHAIKTSYLSEKLVRASEALSDSKLISMQVAGDFISNGAKYHKICLTTYFNRWRSKINYEENQLSFSTESEKENKALALAELIDFMESTKLNDSSVVFKLSDLTKAYFQHLNLTEENCNIHSTRLKEKLMAIFPDLQEYSDGKEVYLIFKEDICNTIKSSIKDQESEAPILAKAVSIIKREIKQKSFQFQGHFSDDDQTSSISSSLMSLLKMITSGSRCEINPEKDQAVLSIAQIIMFNTKERPSLNSKFSRYNSSKEQPLPIYLAFKLHSATRKRELIDKFHNLGLCISYQRYLTLSSEVANSVCTEYIRNDIVCPPQLNSDVFTTAAFDNVDHNTSSTFADGSFHGTSISLMQHVTTENDETSHKVFEIKDEVKGRSTVMSLPDSYAIVPSTFLSIVNKNLIYTASDINTVQETHISNEKDEIDWLNKVSTNLDNEDSNLSLHWPAHHSLHRRGPSRPCTKIALLPLFLENAHSTSMILHAMNVIKLATNKLNPNQVPVITCDQPLFALGQQISLTLPETHGQKDFVFIFGGLHIEMTMIKTIGDYIADSGWTTALLNAGIFTKGKIDNVIHAGHIKQAQAQSGKFNLFSIVIYLIK